MKRVCEKAEARFQISDCSFVADNMELEWSRRVHYRGLDCVISVRWDTNFDSITITWYL